MLITIKEGIFHARKSNLHDNGEPWVKKESGNFDVTMGAYDRLEVFERFMLYLIGKKYNSQNIGLYRNGGLAEFKNVSGPASENVKKTSSTFV